ncbi:MAG TPA: hypothetical protein VHH73_06030, partial [Verrucomicrobiae bacterium]|nr:hypothetical protein [Verrucomicrobiae bacterium]
SGNFPLSGLPIGSMAASSATLTQSGLALSGTVSGGVLSKVPLSPGVTVSATVSLSNSGVALGGAVSVKINPMSFPPFTLSPSSGATFFNATLDNTGLTIPAGATLSFNGKSLGIFTLPAFTIPASGNFKVKLNSVTCSLSPPGVSGAFAVESAAFELNVANGAASANFTVGSLVIPALGGGILGRANVTGSLNADGTFSLSGKTTGSLTPVGLPFVSLATSSTATLTQTGLTVEGNASGGVLSVIPVTGGAAVSAKLGFTTAGVASLSASASVTVDPLVFDSLALAPGTGKTFTATLTSAGMIFPANARLVFNGKIVATSGLPSFTVPFNGNIDFNAGPAAVTLAGFNVESASLEFVYLKGNASVSFSSGKLQVPLGKTSASLGLVSGSIASNGKFGLTASTSQTLSVAPGSLPTMSLGGVTATLGSNGVVLEGNLSGGLLAFVTPTGNVSGKINVATDGSLNLANSINLSVQPLNSGIFHVESSNGGNPSATLGNDGLKITGARLRVENILTLGLPDFYFQFSGNISQPVSAGNLTLGGIPCTGVNFTLVRGGGVMSLSPMEAMLNIPGFGVKVSGSINSGGNMSLQYTGNVTCGGFTASNGKLTLQNSGLTVNGSFNIFAQGHSFSSGISFSGSINASGNYNLTGNGVLDFGGFKTDSFDLKLSNSGLGRNGNAPTLHYGVVNMPLNGFNLNASGVSSFDSAKDVDSHWQQFIAHAVYGRYKGAARLTSAGNGNISGGMSGTFYWFLGPSQPNDSFSPGTNVHWDAGLDSNGGAFVNQSHGGQNGFGFNFH